MNTLSIKTGGIKFVLGWLLVFVIRLIPFRPANFEPMMATIMPYSKKYSVITMFLFSFLSIFLFDLVTSGIGMWTWITAVAYGLLGVGSFFYFKNREATVRHFLTYGIIGTVLYDAVTGLSIGPLFYGQPFMEALTGQISFTLRHLLGTVIFSVVLSPVLYRFVVKNEVLEIPFLWNKIARRA